MRVLITGVTGQAGSYLAESLLKDGHEVTGLERRASSPNRGRISGFPFWKRLRLVQGDVTDAACMFRLISEGYDRVYNLAAQSHVATSFLEPSHTTGATCLGALNCLEAIRMLPEAARPRFYQASSSEMFGSTVSMHTETGPTRHCDARSLDRSWLDHCWQDESTPFSPNSPYAVAKLAAHHLVRIYRESYGLFACAGINFNFESPRRGIDFVTQKIASYVRGVRDGYETQPLRLGNLEARRDWGHARDTVASMRLMLEADRPDDFVIATGETRSVRDFLDAAFAHIGIAQWQSRVAVDPAFFRPCEVPFLRGRADKARRVLGWSPSAGFAQLVREMVDGEGE